MAELRTDFVNDFLNILLAEEGDDAEVAAPKPTGLMANDTATQKAVAEEQEQPKTARDTIQSAIKKLGDFDTAETGEGSPTVSGNSVINMSPNDLYGKHNTPLYKLLSLNKDIDYDPNSLRVLRNTDFGNAYLDNLGKSPVIKTLPRQPRVTVQELGGATPTMSNASDDPSDESTFGESPEVNAFLEILGVGPTEEELMNDNRTDTSAISVVDDGAAVGGASDGKVDEGLMSRPEAEEQYDKEAMLEINEPKGRGIEVNKYSKMMLDGATEKEKLKGIQGILTKLGYKPKGIDGKMGGGTRRALRKLQFMSGIEVNADNSVKSISDIDAATMQALNSTDMKVFPDPPKTDAPVTAFTDADFKIFSDEVGQIESTNNYGIKGGFNNHYLGRYQMGKDALGDTGRKYNTRLNSEFLRNPALQDKLFKKYTLKNHKHLTVNSGKYRDMSNTEKLGILGYAHNQGATAAEEYLVTGIVGTDAFNTKATKYTKAIGNAFRKLQPFAAGAR